VVRPVLTETRLSWDSVLERSDLKPDVLALRDAFSDAVEEVTGPTWRRCSTGPTTTCRPR
jgi:hypothetical protein